MSDAIQMTGPAPSQRQPRSPSPWDGQFFWYELMTTDPAAAADFYTHVVGWAAADFGGPNSGYTVFSAGERGVAGTMALPEHVCQAGGAPFWVGYIHVADCDSVVDRIIAAGGTVHRPPADIPEVGRFAVVADPGGAVFQVMAPFPDDMPPPDDPDADGLVSWRELYAGNGQELAFAFYSRLFGWETLVEMPMGEMGTYRIFGRGGVQMGGLMDKPPNIPVPAWAYYFNVEAIDAAAARVTERGGQILMGPHEVPGGSWIVQCVDPQGAHFALVATRR
ncbi:VOC family protein [Sphingosinicella terrae]|uniref:VOC family protein n=1 Tax=Sphingosinicella terrae TaxID=2172047 RepID=UPI002546D5F3|nr:VOC family protein [Sphingosinicella terrae]